MSRAATVSLAQAARALGVDRRTIRRGVERHEAMVKDPRITFPKGVVVPGVRVGNAVRVPLEWLDDMRGRIERASRSAREMAKNV